MDDGTTVDASLGGVPLVGADVDEAVVESGAGVEAAGVGTGPAEDEGVGVGDDDGLEEVQTQPHVPVLMTRHSASTGATQRPTST